MRTGPENLARTVIFDPVTQNLRATRYGLVESGFRDIEGYSDLSEVKVRLNDGPLDLLICDTSKNAGDVYELVRAIRRGEIAENPFAVVFLTSWRGESEAVRTGLRCGADDIIVRPFSTTFIESRIRASVDNRKKFVVTSDYLGPDRRQSTEMETVGQVREFDPPNTLRAAVTGDRAAMDARIAKIEAFKMVVRRERAVRLAVRIGVEVELAVAGESAASNVHALARELYIAVDQVDPEAAKLAAAMVRGLSSGEDAQKAFKLAKELAVGICIICGPAEGDADNGQQYISEITDLVGSLKGGETKAA